MLEAEAAAIPIVENIFIQLPADTDTEQPAQAAQPSADPAPTGAKKRKSPAKKRPEAKKAKRQSIQGSETS